jgi:RNA polymerase sigma-70 factor (ECF subfamily)
MKHLERHAMAHAVGRGEDRRGASDSEDLVEAVLAIDDLPQTALRARCQLVVHRAAGHDATSPEARQSEPGRRLGRGATQRREDALLVGAALEGEARAATRIVERYTPLVRHCLSASFAGADLDDQAQEVFLRCFVHLARLRDPESLRSFLIGIALRSAAMERRRRRRRSLEALTSDGALPEPGVAQPSIEARYLSERTRAILRLLRPASARALELRFVEEREIRDVAECLGVSPATAKRRLASASARVGALARREPVLAEYVAESRGAAAQPLRGLSG